MKHFVKHFMLRTAVAVSAASLLFVATATTSAQARGPITVLVVRHAEKAATPADDPPLTAEGQARAHALLAAVRDAHIGAIITTQLLRTRSTAEPTAMALGIKPEVVNAGGATHVQDVVAAIRAHVGKTVLVVGHSNTVPAIIEALGAKRPAAICDSQYDDLFIVTISADGTAGVVHANYGVRAPPDPSCATMR
ncbi:MAG: histidine phosphatase family protein [Gemmatimonadaceae bacterium]